MAKTIKFNLILDSYPVRDIEGLQEHFSIEDIINYYDNGLLLKWLEVRGYDNEYNEVTAIDKSLSKKEVIKKLIGIFEIMDLKDADIDKELAIISYLEEKKELNSIYKEYDFEKNRVIDDYHSGYNQLITHMEENKDNFGLLKADAILMRNEYLELFKLNYYELYYRLLENAPKALYALLTIAELKKYWVGEEANKKIYSDISTGIALPSKMKDVLGEDLKIVKRNTQAMWDPIERSEVRLMVLNISSGTFVKNEGAFAEKLSMNDINGKFLILNGLEYQCNNESYELLYVEV